MQPLAQLGFGLGLRTVHYSHVLNSASLRVEWFEVISENFLGFGDEPTGRPLETLLKVRERFPIVLHGVSLSIGGTDPLDKDYLRSLKKLYALVEPAWVSDHLCWTGVHGKNLHDLLPLPYTETTLDHLASRLAYVQDFLGRPLVIENVSSYLSYAFSEMSEWEFLARLVKRTGVQLLLDVNNVFVSSRNHHFDPLEFVNGIPAESVQQIHLAGHTRSENLLIDTHDTPVCPEVWDLYEKTLRILRRSVPTLIERDDHIPEFSELEKELDYARALAARSGVSPFVRSAELTQSHFL